jgi:hypothetical protein
MKVPGKITISKPVGRHPLDKHININLVDSNSHLSIDVKMSLSDFMDAITGQGYMNCEIDFPEPPAFSILGKKMETKTVLLPYGEEFSHQDDFKVWYHELVESYEVDGWKADKERDFNGHRLNYAKKTYQVIFRRWV